MIQGTYHPVATLLGLVSLNLNLQLVCTIVVLGLKSISELGQLLNCVRPNKLLVVEVIKEQAKSLLCILDLRCKCRRSLGSHTLHILVENVYQALSVGRDMRSVTGRMSGLRRR
jgi:hypothetical protein